MIVTGHIENKPLNILLDTGAGESLIRTRTVYQIGKQNKIQPTETIIWGLSKTNLLPKGEIYLKIAVAKTEVQQLSVVMDNMAAMLNIPKSKTYNEAGVLLKNLFGNRTITNSPVNDKVDELRKENAIPKNVTTRISEDNVESSSSSSSSDDEDWGLYSLRRSTRNLPSSVPAASGSVGSQDEQDPFTTASSGAEIEEYAEVTQPIIREIRDTDPVGAWTPVPAERRTSSRNRKPMERLNYNRLGGPKETRGQPDNEKTITEVNTDGSEESQPETVADVTTERLQEIANDQPEEGQVELEMMTDESDESEPALSTNEESHTMMTTDEEGLPDLPTAVQPAQDAEAGPSIPAPVKIEPGKPLKKPRGNMDLAYIAGAAKLYTPEEKVMLTMYRAEKARRKRLEKKQ